MWFIIIIYRRAHILHTILKNISSFCTMGALNILDEIEIDNLILQILLDNFMKVWLEALVMLPRS